MWLQLPESVVPSGTPIFRVAATPDDAVTPALSLYHDRTPAYVHAAEYNIVASAIAGFVESPRTLYWAALILSATIVAVLLLRSIHEISCRRVSGVCRYSGVL